MVVVGFQRKERYLQLFRLIMMINVNFLGKSKDENVLRRFYRNLNFCSLTVGHLIGKGAFGFVYQGLAKGIHSEEKVTTVAIKTVRGKFFTRLCVKFA